MYRLSITTWLLISLTPFVAIGQKGNMPKENCEVWRKDIMRRIYLLKNNSRRDQVFFKTLVKAVSSGNTQAYLFDLDRANPALTQREQKKIATILTDSTFTYTNIFDEQRTVSIGQITCYDIREDWTYQPSSGITTIEITGVAPMVDVYGDQGDYRGPQPLFWLKWQDIRPLLDSVENAATLEWDDYFKDSLITQRPVREKRYKTGVFTATAQRDILLSTDDDTTVHFKNLYERWPDSLLGELICTAALSGSISTFKSSSLQSPEVLSNGQVKAITAPKMDTFVDEINPGTTLTKIRATDFSYRTIRKYSIKEEWRFDIATGKTEIRNIGVGLYTDQYKEDGTYDGKKLLFWCSYDSIVDILRKYRQYHHENNIEWQQWNSRFIEPTRRRRW